MERANPQNREQKKVNAAPVYDGRMTKLELTKEIVNLSSLLRGNVSNVIENIIDIIPTYLTMGKAVSLGELGTLRISFSSNGVENESEFTISKISGVRILFTPSPELRSHIEGIKFGRQTFYL